MVCCFVASMGFHAFGANSESITCAQDVQALKANTFTFDPVRAQFVRINIYLSSKWQPCIDELEIFGPGSKKNLALASNGAVANASSSVTESAKHQIAHLNDGIYKHDRSWICGKDVGWC